MNKSADFAERIKTVGDRIATIDDGSGLRAVQRRRRRHTVRRAAVAVGVVAGVSVPAAAVFLAARTEPPSVVVTATPPATVSPATTVPAVFASNPTSSISPTLPPTTVAEPAGLSFQTPSVVLGDEIPLESFSVSAEDISDGLAPANANQSFTEWLVPWMDGFLFRGPDPAGSAATVVLFSRDGDTWEPFDMSLPDNVQFGGVVASTGERFAAYGFDADDKSRQTRIIFSTTDMKNWRRDVIDIGSTTEQFADGLVRQSDSPVGLVLTDERWALRMDRRFSLNPDRLLEEIGLDSYTGMGWMLGGTDATITVRYSDAGSPTSSEQTVRVDLTELGLTPEQAAKVLAGNVQTVWTGRWDQDGSLAVQLPPTWIGGLASFDAGFVVWNALDLHVVTNDGVAFPMEIPSERFLITSVVSLGSDLLVFTNDANSIVEPYIVNPHTQTWSPTQLQGLAETIEPTTAVAEGSLVMRPRYLPPTVATIESFEQGDYRYTMIQNSPITSYEVLRISTGELVVAESDDFREILPLGTPRFEFLERGSDLAVTDPASGEVIINMTSEEIGQMYSVRTTLDGNIVPTPTLEDFSPVDHWLVAYADGQLAVHDLAESPIDDSRTRYDAVARNGNVVIIQSSEGLFRFDLSPP